MKKLLSIALDGFSVFEDYYKIDLAKIPDNATIGIFGINEDGNGGYDSNGAGKTSFLNSISFALFGKIPIQSESTQVISARELINHKKEKATITLVYDIDGDLITFESSINIKGSIKLKLEINGIRYRANTDTQVREKFYSMMGIGGKSKADFIDFLNRCYFSGDFIKSFASKAFSSKKRFEVLSRIRKVDIYNIAITEALNNMIELENKFKVYDQEIQEINLTFINFNVEENLRKIKEYQGEILNINKEIKIISDELSKFESIKKLKESLVPLEQELNEVKKVIDQNINVLNNVIEQIKFKNDYLKTLENLISELKPTNDQHILEIKRSDIKLEKEKNIENVYNINNKIIELKDKISKLETQEYLNCPECKSDLILEDNSLHSVNKKITTALIKKYQKEIDSDEKILLSENLKKEKLIKSIQELEKEIQDIKDINNKKINYANQKNTLVNEIKELKNGYKDYLVYNHEKLIYEIKEDLKNYEDYEEYNNIWNKIEEIKSLIDESINVRYSINDLQVKNNLLLEYNSNLIVLQESMKKYESNTLRKKELESLENELSIEYQKYEFWETGFRQLKSMEILEIEPLFESVTNSKLADIGVGIEVEYKIDIEKEELELELTEDSGQKISLPLFSTGQTKRIGFCAGLALADLADDSNMNYGITLWDEVLDGLDNSGQELFFELLRKVNGRKFVISHDKKLQNSFEYKILIQRKDNKSSIIIEA